MGQIQDVLSVLFSITGTFYITAAIIVFLDCFYAHEIPWNRKKAVILGGYAVIDAITSTFLEDNIIVGIAVMIAYLFVPVYDCQEGKWRSLLRFMQLYILSMLSVIAVSMAGLSFILPNYDIESMDMAATEDLLGSILITVFFGVVYHYLYRRMYKQGIVIPCGRREKFFVNIYIIFSFVLFLAVGISGRDGNVSLFLMACLVALFSAMFPIFIYYTRISEYYRERTQYQESYLQAELAHFQQYKLAQEETRRFRHDIRNNLLCMNEMLRTGRTEEATEYLHSLIDMSDTLSVKYVSGDEILDCIIAAKAGVMEQKGIAFQLDGVLAGGLPWKPIDVCSVFANALDNAIEACEQLAEEQRRITMQLKAMPRFWFVRIENPVAEDVDVSRLFHEKGGYTSKSNTGQHGIGTFNMKRTVEAYGGVLKAECANQQFVLEIMIDKNSSE